jgi:hypothetical protein
VGDVVGISTIASTTAKQGYLGQLSEVTALQLAAGAASLNELATLQLSATLLLDDLTTFTLTAPEVGWSVQSGALASVNANGLATAAAVYQNSAAVAAGSYTGITGTLNLTVLDSIADNFGSYSTDGLDDDWQALYFGLDNPLAAPMQDPDSDGQTNRFEFTAGIIPTDPASRFHLTLAPVPGQSTQKRAIFSPLVAGRSYTVEYSDSLSSGSWQVLTGTTFTDSGNERTVTDLNASGLNKFYRVKVEK